MRIYSVKFTRVDTNRFWRVVAQLVADGQSPAEAIASCMLRWTGQMGAALEADATASWQRFTAADARTLAENGPETCAAAAVDGAAVIRDATDPAAPARVSDDPGAFPTIRSVGQERVA